MVKCTQLSSFARVLCDDPEAARKAANILAGLLTARSPCLSEFARGMRGNQAANYKAIHRCLENMDPQAVLLRLFQEEALLKPSASGLAGAYGSMNPDDLAPYKIHPRIANISVDLGRRLAAECAEEGADLPAVLTAVVQHHGDDNPGGDGVRAFVRRQRALTVHIAGEKDFPIGRQPGRMLRKYVEPDWLSRPPWVGWFLAEEAIQKVRLAVGDVPQRIIYYNARPGKALPACSIRFFWDT